MQRNMEAVKEWRITVMRPPVITGACAPEGIAEDLTVYAETMPLALEIASRKVAASRIVACHAIINHPVTYWRQPHPLERVARASFPFSEE